MIEDINSTEFLNRITAVVPEKRQIDFQNLGYYNLICFGDVIIQIDDIAVTSLADYYSALESKRPGDTVKVTVRRNKKNTVIEIVLSE